MKEKEGFNKGDLLIVERPNHNEDFHGKMVVATVGDITIIRRFERQNGLIHFPATLRNQPDFKFPAGDVRCQYLVKSVLCLPRAE